MTDGDDADRRELVKDMCRACADDLARWVRAFEAEDEPLLATLLEGLQQHMTARARAVSDG